MKTNYAQKIAEHLYDNGTINDLETDAIYREAHNIPEDEDTDLETVERWAVDTAAHWQAKWGAQ